jgi:hypothetical protein
MLAKRANFLGGKHWHWLFCIPTDRGLCVQRKAELAIIKIMKDVTKWNLLYILDVLLADEIGQLSSEFIATIDLILRRIRQNNIFLGGVLILSTLDHTQIRCIDGHPFLTSMNIITCFKMVELKTSVRASDDEAWQRIQTITRMNHQVLQNNPLLVQEVLDLISRECTFLPDWNHPRITPTTYRLYGKKIPAIEASKEYTERGRRVIPYVNRRERTAEDIEKSRYSHKWNVAKESTSHGLEKQCREPGTLLFFRGAVYDCTFNNNGVHNHSQQILLYDLPSQDDLDNLRKIKVLVVPPGTKEIVFNPIESKECYLDQGFKEIKIGCATERTKWMCNNFQARRRQYGLKHHVTATIHASMGDTISVIATEISSKNSAYKIWEKGMLVVLTSRTRFAKDIIFVGNKTETLEALKEILLRKTQWCEFMENVLSLITVNQEDCVLPSERLLTYESYPLRICDAILPQCNTGFTYMLISIKRGAERFSYIGQTICLRKRLKQHNSGIGSISTAPEHLRPYALFAYICGFAKRRTLREHVEHQWKVKRDVLIQNGNADVRDWARSGQEVINNLNVDNYNIEKSDLRLVLLFK